MYVNRFQMLRPSKMKSLNRTSALLRSTLFPLPSELSFPSDPSFSLSLPLDAFDYRRRHSASSPCGTAELRRLLVLELGIG
jgi:hypothetical protein